MAYRTWSIASGIEDEDEAETETRKGPWTLEEDAQLMGYIRLHGEGRWNFLAKAAGLRRNGRSCRLRWLNSLRPDLKRSKITSEEERLIIDLHRRWGNRWSHIARSLPGRTDNEIKNYWRTRIRGKLNLQDESDDPGMDGLNFELSLGSYCVPTSSQRRPEHDGAGSSSTGFPAQSTQEGAVQIKKRSYPQDGISPQVIPIRDLNDEYVLPTETRHSPSQTNDDGQPDAASHQDLEDSWNQLFENSLPYNFPVGSEAILQYPFDFCGNGATQDDRIPVSCSSYMGACSEDNSDSEAYLNRYSDVLWNMDEEYDRFHVKKHSASQNDRPSY